MGSCEPLGFIKVRIGFSRSTLPHGIGHLPPPKFCFSCKSNIDMPLCLFQYRMDHQVPVSPPRLLDFSCQIFSKAPATDPGNTTTSCLLQLKVSTRCDHVDCSPPPHKGRKVGQQGKNSKDVIMWSLSLQCRCHTCETTC